MSYINLYNMCNIVYGHIFSEDCSKCTQRIVLYCELAA